jgi:hypothetical protein
MCGSASPQALAAGDDIDALVDELTGVSVPQRMEHHVRHADTRREVELQRADDDPPIEPERNVPRGDAATADPVALFVQ